MPKDVGAKVARVSVKTPDGREFVTKDPMHVAALHYPPGKGYRLDLVEGYDVHFMDKEEAHP